uniref:CUB domain-containing protein n=1 Tax=Anolis carolinensis TaxID=28377 RepID=A0A803TAN7_ANOCA
MTQNADCARKPTKPLIISSAVVRKSHRQTTNRACGGTLTEPDGTIATPDYLATYPHGIRCAWTVLVQPGNLIRLTFTQYCGRSVPPSMTSGGNTLMLYFVTNRNVASEGFSVNYISLNASTGMINISISILV